MFWRTYFKGWLEARPWVWRDWADAVARFDAQPVRGDVDVALRGETGIDCFDHWMAELDQTGYLHNWARMNFASIWVFTLGLPWELGARAMFARLVDADPASNTLSWRWVAGLHTRGKAYLADAALIAQMTGGRFAPVGLAGFADIPDAPAPLPAAPVRDVMAPVADAATLLWITPEDCTLDIELARLPVRGVVVVEPVGPGHGACADRLALDDAQDRAARQWGVPAFRVADAGAIAAVAGEIGAAQVVTGRVAVGPGLDSLAAARVALGAKGIALAEHVRAWDRTAWPHATRGYFALRGKIPALLETAGLRVSG